MAEKISHLHVKLSPTEMSAIKREAKKHKVSISEYIRALAYNIMENHRINKALAKEQK
jgi:hypothetical protein